MQIGPVYQKILLTLVCGFIMCLPFIYYVEVPDAALLPRLLVGLSLIVIGSLILLIKEKKIRLGTVELCLVGLLLWSAISTLFAHLPLEGINELARIFFLLSWLILVKYLLSVNDGNIKYISISVAVATLVIIVFAIIDMRNVDGFFSDYAFENLGFIRGNMANKNLLSSALLFGLPFCMLMFFRAARLWKILAVITGLSCMALIILIQTRAAWVALIAAVIAGVLLITLAWKHIGLSRKQRNLSLLMISGSTVAAVVLLFILLPKDAEISRRFLSMFNPDMEHSVHTVTVKERFMLWYRSFQLWLANPVLGVGPGNWRLFYPFNGYENLIVTYGGYTLYQRPHNDYLWVLSETGLPGLLLYIATLSWALLQGLKTLFTADDRMKSLSALIILFGLVAFMVNSVFDFPKERIFHLSMLGIFLAWLSSNKSSYSITVSAKLLFAVTLLLALCFGYTTINQLKAHATYYEALAYRQQLNIEQSNQKIKAAKSPLFRIDPAGTPLEWYEGEYFAQSGQFDKALEKYKTAVALNPYHLHSINNLGMAHYQLGQENAALTQFYKAKQLSPHYVDVNTNLAVYHYQRDAIDSAAIYLFESNPNYTPFFNKAFELIPADYLISLHTTIADSLLQNAVLQIAQDTAWLRDIHKKFKAQATDNSLRNVILEDAIYKLQELDQLIDSNRADALRQKIIDQP